MASVGGRLCRVVLMYATPGLLPEGLRNPVLITGDQVQRSPAKCLPTSPCTAL